MLALTAGEDDVVADVRPLQARYWTDCHNATKTKGEIDLARQATPADATAAVAIWHRAAMALAAGEMPPAKATQPTADERVRLLAFARGKADPVIAWSQVQPVLAAHCHKCHGGGSERKGSLDFAALVTPEQAAKARLWGRVQEALRDGKMPSANEPPPPPEARALVQAWAAVHSRRQEAELDCTNFGADDQAQLTTALRTVWSRRMTRLE